MTSLSGSITFSLFLILLLFSFCLARWFFPRTFCAGIPVVGPSGPFSSCLGAFRFWRDASGMLKEGHVKFVGRPFQIPHADRWVVYVTQPDLVKEIASISDDRLSLLEATNDILQVQFTGVHQDRRIIHLIRSRLARNLTSMVPDIYDETSVAFSDLIPIPMAGNAWVALPALDAMTKAASRIVGRIFVGLPKARDIEYNRLCIRWVHGVIETSITLNAFPQFLRPLISCILNPMEMILQRASDNISPLIIERMEACVMQDRTTKKDDDLLSGIIRQSIDSPVDPLLITRKLMSVNLAAIHTSSNILTHALFHLAAHPEYLEPLRADIVNVLQQDGWSKSSLEKMMKLDSFMKESLRLSSVAGVSILRKVVQPITLSDGSHLPIGTLVMGSPVPIHMDPSVYPNPECFDGFRFCQQPSERLVTPTLEYFPFGYGALACPGRLLAASLLKIMLAYLVLNYDIKLQHASRPADSWVGTMCSPNRTAKILFRYRGQN